MYLMRMWQQKILLLFVVAWPGVDTSPPPSFWGDAKGPKEREKQEEQEEEQKERTSFRSARRFPPISPNHSVSHFSTTASLLFQGHGAVSQRQVGILRQSLNICWTGNFPFFLLHPTLCSPQFEHGLGDGALF